MKNDDVGGGRPGAPRPRSRRGSRMLSVVILTVVAAGCASEADGTRILAASGSTTTTERRTTTTRDTSPPAVREPATTTTTAPEPDIAAIGPNEWFTYTDGVEVQATSIQRFTPEFDDDPRPDVSVTITVRNGSSGVLDLALADAQMYGGANGVVVERGYEFFGFSGSVPPGQTVTADYDFVVAEEHLGQLLVEFSPTWDHDPSFFRGAL